jgi:hypothetical protein
MRPGDGPVWRVRVRDGDTEAERAKAAEIMMMLQDRRDSVIASYEKASARGEVVVSFERDMLALHEIQGLQELAEKLDMHITDWVRTEKEEHGGEERDFVMSTLLASRIDMVQEGYKRHWTLKADHYHNSALYRFAVANEMEHGERSRAGRSRLKNEENARLRDCAYDGCDKSAPVAMLRCGKCKALRYCDTECKKAHHATHKDFCNANVTAARTPGGHSLYHIYRKLRRYYKNLLKKFKKV